MTRLGLRWKAALLAGLTALMQNAATAQTVNYPRDPDTVVAAYRVEVGERADEDSGPSVRVYGDGRAMVHVPRYRKDSGDFTTQLSPAEMNELMASLVANGVLDFDAEAVKQAKREAQQRRGGGAATVLQESTDPSITIIELRVRRNAATGGGAASGGAEVAKTVRWVGLESDAEQFPDVAAIRKLAAASQRMKALMERPDPSRSQEE